MKAKKEVNIYLTNKRNVVPVDVVQYDTGVQLVFTVKDFSIPSEATATLYVQKPSGKFVYQTDGITISDNIITIDLENQALTEHGKVPYQVTITSGTDTVTSFAGLMLVERSLKDAGAVESKTVIKAFDELTADKLAELQTNAKTVIDALIATIPGDYTELTAKVNESANAIKGSLSGAVVRADDVSPVEHLPVVKVHSKNRFISSKIGTTSKFTKNNDGSITVSAGQYSCPTGIQFKDLCPSLSAGETVILSIDTEGLNFIYSNAVLKHGVPFVVTENILEGYVAIYGAEETANDFEEEHTIRHIQIEKGETATEYTPYVDPSTVTVTAGGKAYTPNADGTIKGISSTVLADGISTEAEGMTIECEYNKDTNKVIQKLVNVISAMGGEITI